MLCNEKTELLAARDNTIACFREHVDGTEQKLARAEKLEDEIAGLITEKSELQAIYMEEKKRADEEKKRADEAERRLAKAKKLQELMSGLFSGNEHSGRFEFGFIDCSRQQYKMYKNRK